MKRPSSKSELVSTVAEALRMVQALQYFEKYGEVCPANWKEGASTIKPNLNESKEFFETEYATKA